MKGACGGGSWGEGNSPERRDARTLRAKVPGHWGDRRDSGLPGRQPHPSFPADPPTTYERAPTQHMHLSSSPPHVWEVLLER